MTKIIYVVQAERRYTVGMFLLDLVLGFLTCGIWWIIRLLWWALK